MRCANLSLRYKGLPENDPKIAESLCNFSYRLLVCGPRQFTALSWFEQKCVNSCYTLDKRIKYTNALSICPDKIFFVLDKIRFVLDKIILSMTKYFLSMTKILSTA